MKNGVSVKTLMDQNRDIWHLELLTGENGLNNTIQVNEVNRPGLALAGYFGYFAYERVQVFGKTELTYLSMLSKSKINSILSRIFQYNVPCFIITRKLNPAKELIEQAAKNKKPVIRTTMMTTRFISELTNYLEDKLAPSTSVHGVLVDVFGVGVLILGKSGLGKSECAIALIKRGHRLVADDVVNIRRSTEHVLVGTRDENIGYCMEIRGVGIIDIKELFGITSVRDEKQIQLVAVLEEWKAGREYDRLGLEESLETILDVTIPKVIIPVRPGRDLALILEIAAVNLRAKEMGVFSAKNFEEKTTRILKASN